jgi:hypothetical protein
MFSALLGFRKALADRAAQRRRPERLAQTLRHAEAERHFEAAGVVPLINQTAFHSIAQRFFCLANQHTIPLLPQIAALSALHRV